MESLCGKTAYALDSQAFAHTLAGYAQVLVDLGTGDGRFVQYTAHTKPSWFVIGVDACRENLRNASRTVPGNTRFLIANALDLPTDLHGVATHITVNFPWGSLLQGLLHERLGLLAQIAAIARPKATVEVRLNAGALATVDWELDAGGKQICLNLARHGFQPKQGVALDAAALRALNTTWAKRLAFGRNPRALSLAFERLSD